MIAAIPDPRYASPTPSRTPTEMHTYMQTSQLPACPSAPRRSARHTTAALQGIQPLALFSVLPVATNHTVTHPAQTSRIPNPNITALTANFSNMT